MYLYLVKILEDNYPEMLKRLFVVNGKLVGCLRIFDKVFSVSFFSAAPSIFPVIWKICRPLISEATKNKIHVLGGEAHVNFRRSFYCSLVGLFVDAFEMTNSCAAGEGAFR